ncbi:DNA-binding response OmpR family regulator [Devosia sp. UYZn731]|uniref:response regulator n=1 Tax=Devosia sp. UYZn731 TaxID=3156345 RepID=UPI0033997270
MTDSIRTLAGRRVLIVEDEALIVMAVEDEVRQLGCTDIFVAYNKEQALVEIDSYKPGFAILDLSLTDNGEDYDIADRLAERGIPFIFSSGHLAAELPDRHVGRPFVGKPMQSKDFAEAVTMALR